MVFVRFSRCTAVVLCLALLGGCGGSTKGTGGITVEGRLLESTGAPVSEASVTVLSTGDATITDADGAFVLGAPAAASVDLLFESGQTSAQTSIPVTGATTRVVGTFRLDRESESVDADEVEIEEEDDAGDDNGGDDGIDSENEADGEGSDDTGFDDNGSDDGELGDDGEDSEDGTVNSDDDPENEDNSGESEENNSGEGNSGSGGSHNGQEGESEED